MIKCPECGCGEVKVLLYKYDRPMKTIFCANEECKRVHWNGEDIE